MKVKTTPRQTLEPRHHFALLGLSEPSLQDEVVGDLVPFKLSEAEQEYMLEETDISIDVGSAVEEAEQYFSENYPNGRIYYKKSRFYKGSALHSMKYAAELTRFSCC